MMTRDETLGGVVVAIQAIIDLLTKKGLITDSELMESIEENREALAVILGEKKVEH